MLPLPDPLPHEGEGSKTKAFFAVHPSPLGEGLGVRVFGRGKLPLSRLLSNNRFFSP
jgi:hypothetical protein